MKTKNSTRQKKGRVRKLSIPKKKKKAGRKIFPQYIGTLQMTREGFAFVKVEGQEEDIFIKAAKTRGALNNDLVRVAVTRECPVSEGKKASSGKNSAERREGEVIEIVERSTKPFVGIFHKAGKQAWVLMQSRNMPYDIEVDPAEAERLGAQKGYKVAVLVDEWNRHDNLPKGHLVDVLGPVGDNNTEMHAILAEYNLPYRFESDVEQEAERIGAEIGEAELKDRRDFRQTFTFTIDPSDAKDFDDALSFEALDNGNFQVGVHIADVSWYVREGSLIDKEARNRGTSVYLVDRTIPMLPEKLCNRLCSLREGEQKLCFSVLFEISPDAKIRKKWIGRSVIESDRRLDYEQAQAIIEKEPSECPDRLELAVKTLNRLAGILKARRQKSGAIDFDRPEMKVRCDENGKPLEVYQKYSCEANYLIEEFMLLANKTVAEFVSSKGKTFVYRIHDEPNAEKLQNLRTFAKGFGYKMSSDTEGRKAAKAINDLLAKSKGSAEGVAFKELALRSMAKARYSTDNIGHYGLAFADYTHFTSPIRRYPDLMVHRLLWAYLNKGKSQDKDFFENECKYASERENIATDAERSSIKYKLVEYMQERVGMEYDGHISGLTEWGMYVETEGEHIEGMVALRDIRGDFFEFDEKLYRLRGRRSHKIYRLGDQVRIRVKNANLEQRLLDFELIEK
ncbi:MAG: ribonuclease R [Candidatus Cryptobacteroides sp.]